MTTYKLLSHGNMWDVPMDMSTNKAHKRIAIVEKVESFVQHVENNAGMIHLIEFCFIFAFLAWLFA
jgi:hypothetical protein